MQTTQTFLMIIAEFTSFRNDPNDSGRKKESGKKKLKERYDDKRWTPINANI